MAAGRASWPHHAGQRARKLTATAGAAFQTQGLRLVFHLLTNPEWLLLPNLNLAKRTRVPLQAATAALEDLEAQGFLKVGNGRQLTNIAGLVTRWAVGYDLALRPNLSTQRYRWKAGIDASNASRRRPAKLKPCGAAPWRPAAYWEPR